MTHFPVAVIAEREFFAYQADLRGQIFRQIHRAFRSLKTRGFTQRKYAKRMRMDPAQLSRIMKGDNDLRLETLSDLARALEYRIEVRLIPVDSEITHQDDEQSATVIDLNERRDQTRANVAYKNLEPRTGTIPATWAEQNVHQPAAAF